MSHTAASRAALQAGVAFRFGLALVALSAIELAGGCVPSTPREDIGGYCHRDRHCQDGLRCVYRVCRNPDGDPVASDAGAPSPGAADG